MKTQNFKRSLSFLIITNRYDFSMSRLSKIITWNAKIIFTNPLFLVHKFYFYIEKTGLVKRKKNARFSYKNHSILIPNLGVPIITAEDIFVNETYHDLNGLQCVLDLGAYLGLSTVYLAKHNKFVVAVEPDDDCFTYLKKNTTKIKNVESHEGAIDVQQKTVTFYREFDFDTGGNTTEGSKQAQSYKVKTIDIKKLHKDHTFDGLKMNVEGAEFALFNLYIKKTSLFTYKRGIIELHFFGKNTKNWKIFVAFYALLKKQSYHTVFNRNPKIRLEDIQKEFEAFSSKGIYHCRLSFYKK
ncbi:MAG: FkbM family methyltransferase [Candidatus Woesearchaeota archaeon]